MSKKVEPPELSLVHSFDEADYGHSLEVFFGSNFDSPHYQEMVKDSLLYHDWAEANGIKQLKDRILSIIKKAGIEYYALIEHANSFQIFVDELEEQTALAAGLNGHEECRMHFYKCSPHASLRQVKKEAKKFARQYKDTDIGKRIQFAYSSDENMVIVIAPNGNDLVEFVGTTKRIEKPHFEKLKANNPALT